MLLFKLYPILVHICLATENALSDSMLDGGCYCTEIVADELQVYSLIPLSLKNLISFLTLFSRLSVTFVVCVVLCLLCCLCFI